MGKIAALIPAAGQGKRMGSQLNKQFLSLAGLPILLHTLKIFQACERISEIVIVGGLEEVEYIKNEIVDKHQLSKVIQVVAGGAQRQHSVYNGLRVLSADVEYVAIHDGARPLLTPDTLDQVLAAAMKSQATIVAVPVKDTIKIVDQHQTVQQTPDRATLWSVQTPQVFSKELVRKAYIQAQIDNYLGTDDASLVERLGWPVEVIMGSYENLKITTPEDLEVAENILRRRKHCVLA